MCSLCRDPLLAAVTRVAAERARAPSTGVLLFAVCVWGVRVVCSPLVLMPASL